MGKLRIGKRVISIASLLLVVIMILSSIVGGYLVINEVRTGGMQVKWTLNEPDVLGNHQNNYGIASVDPNGSLIATEYLSVSNGHHADFVDLSPDGKVMWKAGFNGFPWLPLKGADGGFYYVDFKNATVFLNNSDWAYQNLTALNPDGQYKWSFQVDNGTIQVWATYPDGEVIANHYTYGQYNSTSGKYENITNEIIALSSTGQIIWRENLDSFAGNWTSFQSPSVRTNGTFVVYAETEYNNQIVNYEVVYNISSGNYYSTTVDWIPSLVSNGPNSLYYYELTEAGSNVTTVYAGYTNNNSYAWKTVIENPNNGVNYSGGTYSGPCIADGKGIIYTTDSEGRNIFALSSDGRILWERPSPGSIIAGYASGGILCRGYSSVIKINSDGSTAWQYDFTITYSSDLVSTALGPDGTVYFVQDHSLVALAHSDFSNNLIELTVLIVADIAIIAYYFVWRNRHKTQLKDA